ncbi:hypothetical protein DOTSEDRAFT_37372 [Dothistroma septosporum NZE10]|uniref:Uncharacterized protein n=1 Tax=Dothistroma septosporum (strain NZE10 / CBS 128990) TaxID=675120 RepID=N1PEM4_DOTSN|nr:hypothetical protein DOTSEDRAFT_37372 [Dothistroma septosporum NZE10]
MASTRWRRRWSRGKQTSYAPLRGDSITPLPALSSYLSLGSMSGRQGRASLKADIDKAVARIKFLLSTFDAIERFALTPHDHGKDDSHAAQELMRNLPQLSVDSSSIEPAPEVSWMERAKAMITTQVSICYEVVCVSDATTISPRRNVPLREISPCIQMKLPCGVIEDSYVIGRPKPHEVKQLLKPVTSKCRVATKSGNYSTRDGKDDRTKEATIHHFEEWLESRGTQASNGQNMAAKAGVAWDHLIKLDAEDLNLHWAQLPSGAREDVELTATRRFHALLNIYTDTKADPIDRVSEASANVAASAVLAPRK